MRCICIATNTRERVTIISLNTFLRCAALCCAVLVGFVCIGIFVAKCVSKECVQKEYYFIDDCDISLT